MVSTHYLDNGDNNTLFFLFPVFLIVGLSYLFLRLDLLVVQFAAMSLSFCGHYYLDNQYHVAGSWLGRFSWFRRKQQLHFIHHRYGNCNFAVIDFFWDRLLGTYRLVEIWRMHCDIHCVTATSTNRNLTLRRRASSIRLGFMTARSMAVSSAIIIKPPTNSAASNCQPISTAMVMPSSKTRLVEANWKAIAAIKSAPLRGTG